LDGGEAAARRVRNAMTCILNQNNYGQRTGVTTGGTAFTGSPSWLWGYNNKGEVVKADSSEAGRDRAYQYDGIGNRQSGGDVSSPISYTPNALNQYSAIGSLNPSYDDDGNMTSGPLPANVNANSTLVWDAENRLIQAQVNSGATVNFVYDSQSRRIAETVGSATTVYIYDGWNPIAEYNTTFALIKTYTWGIDLSGSMQGAGGVGGLLSVTDSTGTYFPTFDGNGNVSEYLDSTGNIVAHYEYDAFGKIVVATGSKFNDFAHRFSTKPLDLTTGLYYYGYRFYDPETGRWPSRDPIEEEGGVNLYGFVGNNGVGMIDVLGLHDFTVVGGILTIAEQGHDMNIWQFLNGGFADAFAQAKNYSDDCGCKSYVLLNKKAFDARLKQGAKDQPAGAQNLPNNYWSSLEKSAKDKGLVLLEYETADDLIKIIQEKAKEKPCEGINSLSYFGHAIPSSLLIGYGTTDETLDLDDLLKLKDSFAKAGSFRNFGCNGANGTDSICYDFTEKTGITSIGADNTVGYGPVGKRESRYPTPNFTDSYGNEIAGSYWNHTRDSTGKVQRNDVTDTHTNVPFPK
jgi:RHS repeat-associated protein